MVVSTPRWGKFVAAQAVAGVAGAVGAGINLLGDAVLESKQRWMPSIAAIPWVMVLVAVASFLVLVGWMVLRGPLRGTRRRGLIAALWVVAQLGTSVSSVGAILATEGNWLFGSSLVDRMTLPGGRQTAYLYRTGFFCGYDLYLRESGSLVLDKVRHLDREDCGTRTVTAHLEWRADEGVVLFDDQGEVVDGQPMDFSGLYWGPH